MTKSHTIIYKTLHSQLKIDEHTSEKKIDERVCYGEENSSCSTRGTRSITAIQ